MSSNNELVIIENRENNFEVHINNCVDNDFISSEETLLKKFGRLRDACKFANKYVRENMIEYGVRMVLKDGR